MNRIIDLTLNKRFNNIKIFIRNKNLPICLNCLHFIENTNNYPYDSSPSYEDYGRCKKFGKVNLITGVIEYDSAINCRLNDRQCGNSGLEYIDKIKP